MIISEQDMSSIVSALQPPADNLPLLLFQQYDCADIHHMLKNMRLSRKGVTRTYTDARIQVCTEFRTHLPNCAGSPPKFAIANGFYVGWLPDRLYEAKWIEKVTQLVTVVTQTRIMRGGQHHAIRSHCTVFDSTPAPPPVTLLPRRVDSLGSYTVVLAGPFTDEHTSHIRKLHRVRGKVVNELIQFFFMRNNHFLCSSSVS